MLPDEEDVRQKITKMMRDVMNPNKAPPRAAPAMIPGEESTMGYELLYLNLLLLRLCYTLKIMTKEFNTPVDLFDSSAPVHKKDKDYITCITLRI